MVFLVRVLVEGEPGKDRWILDCKAELEKGFRASFSFLDRP
jgi:hypothetical protein